MTDMPLFFAAGLPTITVLLGIILSQRSVEMLEKRIDGFEQRTDGRSNRLESRLDRIEADLREFYRTLSQHDSRLDAIEERGA